MFRTRFNKLSKTLVNLICSTALQTVMARMEQLERSNQQMERSMVQMKRSMEELRLENRRAMNIGHEMDQEIDTNVYQ